MSRTLVFPLSLLGAVAALGLFSAPGLAVGVVSDDMESYSTGVIGTVTDFSDASYGGANPVATIVSGNALDFQFDLKTQVGNLNTNVTVPFPAAAVNNSSSNLADYTLDFDLIIPSGSSGSGYFGALEIIGAGVRGNNFFALPTPGGGPLHYSWNFATDMVTNPWESVLDPAASSSWSYRFVVLSFPPNVDQLATHLQLDNVVITSAVPEPASQMLFGLAAGAMCFVWRRSRG